jgi:hypothetical protein
MKAKMFRCKLAYCPPSFVMLASTSMQAIKPQSTTSLETCNGLKAITPRARAGPPNLGSRQPVNTQNMPLPRVADLTYVRNKHTEPCKEPFTAPETRWNDSHYLPTEDMKLLTRPATANRHRHACTQPAETGRSWRASTHSSRARSVWNSSRQSEDSGHSTPPATTVSCCTISL